MNDAWLPWWGLQTCSFIVWHFYLKC
jgi:hypothetical protein